VDWQSGRKLKDILNKRAWGIVAITLVARAAVCQPVLPAAGKERLYIGTYTSAASRGIYQSSLDLAAGTFGATNLAAIMGNPSFLALHPTAKFLYAVDEGGGSVMAFSAERSTGALTWLNQQPSGGAAPCHLVVDSAGKNLLVANYTGGSITVFPIQPDGQLGPATAHIQHPGSSPHAHCITLDAANRFALVCDLGLDRIYCYRFDSAQGTLTTNSVPWTSVPVGAGPRHLAMDPSYRRAYVICELNSTIIGYNYDPQVGVLNLFQTISSIPSGWNGINAAAEIAVHPSGKFLYASNRGYNSVAVFAVDEASGALKAVQQQAVGQTPRHFAIEPSGAFCLVANQDSDSILVYAIDPQNGTLTPSGQKLQISKPVCVLPIITQAPQPVMALRSLPAEAVEIDISKGLSSLTYQIYHAPALQSRLSWSLLATGMRGQTNFILTNVSSSGFFRANVLTNY